MANEQTDQSKTTSNPRSMLNESCDPRNQLIGDIQTLLCEDFELRTRASLMVLLNRLIQNLSDMLQLSSTVGCLSIVLEKRPSWSRQINELHQANLDCVSSLELVRDCLGNDGPVAVTPQKIKLRLRNWIESFSAIRCLESKMFQEAFTLDIGGEA